MILLMKNFQKKYLLTFSASLKRSLGVLLILSVPFLHNLHNVLPKHILEIKIKYHIELIHLLWISEHSFAPMFGLFGAFLITESKLKYFLGVPFGFLLYKTIEKLPIRENYNIREEFIFIGVAFSIAYVFIFWLLDFVWLSLNPKIKDKTDTLKALFEVPSDKIDETTKREIADKTIKELEKDLTSF